MPTPAATSTLHAAAARPPFGMILLLGSMTAVGAMSIDLYLPSLPTMGRAFHASPGAVGATLTAFLVGMGIGQLVHGPLSDRRGRRGPLLAGLALYVAASIAAALAPSIGLLIAARFLQGLGGCAALVINRAVVRDRYATQDAARIFSLLLLVMGVAPVLAPLAGSGLLAMFDWRAIFWVLALFGGAVGLAVQFGLPETRTLAAREAVRAIHPARVYWNLLRNPRLVGHLIAIAFSGASLFVYVASSSLLFIGDFGLTPTQFSGLFATNAIAFIASAQVNRLVLDRFVSSHIAGRALSVAFVVGTAFALTSWTVGAGLWASFGFCSLTMATYGFAQSNLTAETLGIDAAHPGSIAALSGTASFGVGAVAASIATALHDGTARPPATVIAVCATVALCAYFGLARGRARA